MRFFSKSSCCLYECPPHCSQSPVCLKCVCRKRKLLIDSLEWTLTWITFLLIESLFSRYACEHNPNNARFFSGGLRCCECAFHLTAHNLQCFCSQKTEISIIFRVNINFNYLTSDWVRLLFYMQTHDHDHIALLQRRLGLFLLRISVSVSNAFVKNGN